MITEVSPSTGPVLRFLRMLKAGGVTVETAMAVLEGPDRGEDERPG